MHEDIYRIYKATLQQPNVLQCIEKLRTYDEVTYTHSYRVCFVALTLGVDLFLPDKDLLTLGVGSLLHDYGKLHVPKEILNKEGKLTNTEWECMKLHPLYGAVELQRLGFVSSILQMVAEHHEGVKGQGYPLGKTYSELSVMSRIVLVADIYDALTSNRDYRLDKFTPKAAVNILMTEAKADTEIIDLLKKYLNFSPSGQKVEV